MKPLLNSYRTIFIIVPIWFFINFAFHYHSDYFIIDDQYFFLKNPSISNFKFSKFITVWQDSSSPLLMNYWQFIYGILEIKSAVILRIFNLTFHLLCTLIAYRIINFSIKESVLSKWLTLLFFLHPLAVEPISWISEVRTLLGTLFAFLSLYYYLKFQNQDYIKARVLPIIYYLISILVKPTFVLLYLYFLVNDFFILGIKKSVKKHFLPIVGMFFIITRILQVYSFSFRDYYFSGIGVLKSLTLSIKKLFLIYPAGIYNTPPARSFEIESLFLVDVYDIVILSILVIILLRFNYKNKNSQTPLTLFFLSLIPFLGFIPIPSQAYSIIADRFLYPSILFLMICLGLVLKKYRSYQRYILPTLTIIFFLFQIKNIFLWSDHGKLLYNSIQRNNLPEIKIMYANYLSQKKRNHEAIEYFEAVRKSSGGSLKNEAVMGLADQYLKLGNLKESSKHLNNLDSGYFTYQWKKNFTDSYLKYKNKHELNNVIFPQHKRWIVKILEMEIENYNSILRN